MIYWNIGDAKFDLAGNFYADKMNKVLVIGDACQDVFHYGSCYGMAPDVPIPVLTIEETEGNFGMAMNVAANIRALGVECDIEVNPGWEKITKERYGDANRNYLFLRVDTGTDTSRRWDRTKDINFPAYEAVVVSDYDKGFLAEEDITYICKRNDNVFLDTKKLLGPWCEDARVIKINYAEFLKTKHTVSRALQGKLVITRGKNGSSYRDKIFPTKEVEVKDVSGAGDTFLAGLCVKYLEARDLVQSIEFATRCSEVVVQKRGVSTV